MCVTVATSYRPVFFNGGVVIRACCVQSLVLAALPGIKETQLNKASLILPQNFSCHFLILQMCSGNLLLREFHINS